MRLNILSVGLCLTLMGCHHGRPEVQQAFAQLKPTQNNSAQGWLKFEPRGQGLRVWGSIQGLKPGLHGFHIHQFGDCSAPDGSSAGGHFAPRSHQHGNPETAAQHHVGDLGNIRASLDGSAQIELEFDDLALYGEHSIVGRAVVLHAGQDDLSSQPSGDAGSRVACGVIGIQK